MDIKFKNLKNKKTSYILLILILLPFFINFDFIFSKYFFYYDLISNYKIKNPSTAINMEWNKTIISNGKSDGRDVFIDGDNKVYVVGKIFNSTKNAYDIITIKYDNLGNQIWNRTWGGNLDDYGYAIDSDSANNLYIVGQTSSYGNNSVNICLIKYNNSGNLLWNVTWGSHKNAAAFGVFVGNDNKVYVTGYTESFDFFGDSILLKYDTSGILEWNKFWGGIDSDIANDIAIDLLGNIFITGYTSSFGAETSDLFLAKFNNSGELKWNITWGGRFPDSGDSLQIDSKNNILIVGNTQNFGQGSVDIVLLKLNNDGEQIWNKTWGSIEYDYGYSIALDSKENIFLSGYSNSNDGNDKDTCLIKFDPLGNLIWNKFWGKEFDDISYGIDIDSYDNIFITGESESTDNNNDLFLLKYSPFPDNFNLTSLEDMPDIDGNFTLSWSESLDAANYTLFLSTNYITEINENLTKIIDGYANYTYKVENLLEGTFYFKVVAFNEYGSTSSNCLKIRVKYIPTEFYLYDNMQDFITNGIINLTWTNSIGVDNYLVYVNNVFIHDFQNKGTMISEDLIDNFFQIGNFTNGDYFFVIIANNEVGQTMSNCIKVKVRRAPFPFILTTDADQPDLDGNFDLIWTRSKFSQNYSIFYSKHFISELNESVEILYEGFKPSLVWPTYRYDISNKGNGTYFFKIVAYNQYGNQSTNCVEVIINIPKDNDDNIVDEDINRFQINKEIILLFILVCLLGILIFIGSRYKKYHLKLH